MTVHQPLLEMRDINKSFGGVKALDGASFRLERGEAHAIMGINGSGKSTLMKILCGAYMPDRGDIILDGTKRSFSSPHDAEQAGISIVYQEFRLMPELSVAENVFMGHFPYKHRVLRAIDWKKVNADTDSLFKRIGIEIDPATKVGKLSVGHKQMVEIAKALSVKDVRLLILDEPTSALTDEESDRLFTVMKSLKNLGLGLVYITHKLQELRGNTDRVTVLRDGRNVLTRNMDGNALPDLIDAMLGEKFVRAKKTVHTNMSKQIVLSAQSISSSRLKGPVDINVSKGEIVGLVGQMGSGRSEALRALFGLDRLTGGEVFLKGKSLSGSPRSRVAMGMGYLPEDRKTESIIPGRDVRENITLGILKQISKRLRISRVIEKRTVSSVIQKVDLRPASPVAAIDTLSGGNQQKAMLGRWLDLDNLHALLLDEPTRGVDVGAKRQIYSILSALAKAGMAVLIASSDIEEILEICDRVILMKRGQAILEKPTSELDMASLTTLIVSESAIIEGKTA